MNTTIKLLSLNVSLFDQNNDKLTEFLKNNSFDIVCFQEVTRKVDNFALDSFITKDAIDKVVQQLNNSFYVPNMALKDFKQNNFHGENVFKRDFKGVIEYGNYFKSRFEIIEGKSIFLQENFTYFTDWVQMETHPGEEPRTVQVIDIKINNLQKLRILNYHGIWSKNKQGTSRTKVACQKIVQLASEASYPSIICGDFNLFPDTQSMQILKNSFRSLVDEFGIMSTRPKSNELSKTKRNVVDYVFISKDIQVKAFKAIDSDASDHFPLVLEFKI